ncbi:MAG TPA: ribbon-helix-helix protein, CopG family [Candidatus Methanomethylia archaeon]|nr:ribbon-helix-helix protein, CopG family [Candidatus Methanomethylicia archaeon]
MVYMDRSAQYNITITCICAQVWFSCQVFARGLLSCIRRLTPLREKLTTISIRVPETQAKEIEELAKKRGVDKSSVARELIALGLKEVRLAEALNLIRERRITIWRAAELTGLTYREILEKLRKRNIPFPLSLNEILEELRDHEGSL